MGAGPLPVVSDYGLDFPHDWESSAWWMPAPHAARLLRSGAELTLASPRVDLLSLLPHDFLGRSVETCRLGDASWSIAGWFKPADVKSDALPAQHVDAETFLAQASAVLQPDSWVQFTPTTLDILVEYRFFVQDARVTTGSAYLSDGVTYYDGLSMREGFQECSDFAQEVVDFLSVNMLAPASFVIDVALTPQGPRVLEFNPSWCAGFYGASLPEVVSALVAASDPSQTEHLWAPDPFYVERAQRMRPLV